MGTYGLKLDSSIVTSALKSIAPKSPLWALELSLMEIAIRYSNNYELYKGYIISAMNENFSLQCKKVCKAEFISLPENYDGKASAEVFISPAK